MADGCVYLSESTADALDALNISDVSSCNAWGKMAELFFILKELPDDERTFPRGKWATIQEIERQVQKNARERARNLKRPGGRGKVMSEEATTVEVQLWSDGTNAETIEHIIEGRRGGMNKNQELHELFGKCWHEYDLLGSFYCLKCEKQYEKFERNPDYADDPRLVLGAVRERDILRDFLFFANIGGSDEDDSYVSTNLILDKTGKLRDLAIEFLRRENDTI